MDQPAFFASLTADQNEALLVFRDQLTAANNVAMANLTAITSDQLATATAAADAANQQVVTLTSRLAECVAELTAATQQIATLTQAVADRDATILAKDADLAAAVAAKEAAVTALGLHQGIVDEILRRVMPLMAEAAPLVTAGTPLATVLGKLAVQVANARTYTDPREIDRLTAERDAAAAAAAAATAKLAELTTSAPVTVT